MLADDERVIHFADGDAMIDGRRRYWRTIGIFHLSGVRIAAVDCSPSTSTSSTRSGASHEGEVQPRTTPAVASRIDERTPNNGA
jgi:hypothetical protein